MVLSVKFAMKKFILILSLLGFVGLGNMACAQAETATGAPKKAKAAEAPAVPTALKKLKTFNGKPNMKAKYYIYLQSASWCGYCRKEMPDIVREYKKMKKGGVEIILCSRDKTPEDARNYIKEFGIKFPAVMDDPNTPGPALPGFERLPGGGIPVAVLVDAQGKQLRIGQGKMIADWKRVVQEEDKKAAQQASAED